VTTRSAISFWMAVCALFYSAGFVASAAWPPLARYRDVMAPMALSLACFANFPRNRTLHCGLTGPWFLLVAIVVLLIDMGYRVIDSAAVWAITASGVTVAFLIEFYFGPRPARGQDV
jgi:hypothetical protein